MTTWHRSYMFVSVCLLLLYVSGHVAQAAGPFPDLRSGKKAAGDEVVPGNTGTYVNDPTLGVAGAIIGEPDTAVAFGGTDQYLSLPVRVSNIEDLGAMLGSFSVEFWYRSKADNRQKCIMGTLNDGSNTALQVECDKASGRFALLIRSEGGPEHLMRVFMSPSFSNKMADGSYHHVVWVVTAAAKGAAKVYLDGQEDAGASVDGSSAGKFVKFKYDFVIGATNSRGAVGQHVKAVLDEVALYPHPLSQSRVKCHYVSARRGTVGSYAKEILSDSPFAYWRLGDSSPQDLNLLLDARLVEKTENAVLRVSQVAKHPANPLFGQEHSWEVMFNNLYPNVLYDEQEKLYKIWYSMFIIDSAYANTTPAQRTPGTYMDYVRRGGTRRDGEGYAISADGIHWEKPMMDIVPWEGKKSNLVATHVHGAGVLKDLTERDPARRYKMFFKGRNMAVRFSEDGLHWGKFIDCPEIGAAGDAHNNALWVPELNNYVGFTRIWDEQHSRVVARTQSPDFVHWTRSQVVFRGKKLFDIYSMPVIRYGSVYIGLPAIFDEKADRVWTELAWSPDTIEWHRIDEGNPLIPNSPTKGHYDWGTVYASFPILRDNEIRIYYGGCDGSHFDWRNGFLCLASLRPDGFAGYEPREKSAPAVVVTKLVTLGTRLRITADAEGGSVMVSVLDEAGQVRLTSQPVSGNVTDTEALWNEDPDVLKSLVGTKVHLRFEISKAKLYSFLL